MLRKSEKILNTKQKSLYPLATTEIPPERQRTGNSKKMTTARFGLLMPWNSGF